MLFLGGTVFGVLLDILFNAYIRRPRLMVVGSGAAGGPGPGYHVSHLSIRNRGGFIGIKLRETVLFGKTLHNGLQKGFTVEANPARMCTAWLADRTTGRILTGLYWRGEDGQPTNVINLNSEEAADLLLFARLDDEPTKYFVFRPGPEGEPVVPSSDARMTGTYEFIVELQWSDGIHKARFDVTMMQNLDSPAYLEL